MMIEKMIDDLNSKKKADEDASKKEAAASKKEAASKKDTASKKETSKDSTKNSM